MLRAVNWSEKLGHLFSGHSGRILRILLLFLCALGVLVGIYRARSDRLVKENHQASKNQLKSPSGHTVPAASTTKWVIVRNPDSDEENVIGNGTNYVCSLARLSQEAGWKTIIISKKLKCCKIPDCYPIHQNQFLKMTYRTSTVMKNLIDSSLHPQSYKESYRNLAYIWAIHRGARYIFDAYIEEYLAANVSLRKFEEELHRQLHTLALDESLALVEERSRSRTNSFRNPYSHFGRPDVRLLPSGSGIGHLTLPLASNGYGDPHHSIPYSYQPKIQEFPTFRICEVRPPSIEKFLEIDEGWWDQRAPALILPGDTMPPLCTRNTLFSPEVFWALPLLPDYSLGDNFELSGMAPNASRIPPWYIRGLWSQSLLGDLGGSIRLTLSRVPTLQLNQDYFVGGDYEPTQNPISGEHTYWNNRTGSSKLLKRWHCRNRSTFRCLYSMTKELAKSVYMNNNDTSLIDAWIADLRSIHYTEPPILPKRRSHINPCLGADGLPGVSFFPALEPDNSHKTHEHIAKRNQTLRKLISSFELNRKRIERSTPGEEKEPTEDTTTKLVDQIPINSSTLSPATLDGDLVPPDENSTYSSIDWEAYAAESAREQVRQEKEGNGEKKNLEEVRSDSYNLPTRKPEANGPRFNEDSHPYHLEIFAESFRPSLSRRVLPLVGDDSKLFETHGSRNGRHMKGFPNLESYKTLEPSNLPILKAIADNMCPGFAPLLPYETSHPQSDVLLIVVFTNQHYDLIPTLEVIYRSTYSNILYCGHPHESVEIFLKKYQSVEHRSFSFLPTYTKATYECVLGAMEMNYEVKGYLVVTDETLLQTWNMNKIDKSKLWISTSGYAKVTKTSWPRLDPGGQKLPKLLDGIISTWKLLSSILLGSDSFQLLETRPLEPSRNERIKRELKETDKQTGPETKKINLNESLNTEESAYIQLPNYRWSFGGNPKPEKPNEETDSDLWQIQPIQRSTTVMDLLLSDSDHLKTDSPDHSDSPYVQTTKKDSATDETTEEEILVGDENEEEIQAEETSSEGTSIFLSSPATDLKDSTDEDDGLFLATPTSSSFIVPENLTMLKMAEIEDYNLSTTTIIPESSVGVPLYHVEHVEPPTSPTWHKPNDFTTSTLSTFIEKKMTKELIEKIGSEKEESNLEIVLVNSDTEKEIMKQKSHKVIPELAVDGNENSATSRHYIPSIDIVDVELKHLMESALEILHDIYGNLTSLVSEYKAIIKSTNFNYEENLEGEKSHRISPREFRHIRCTMSDDRHQSDLCTILRSYIEVLNINTGRDVRLFHDTIPVYYLPTWTTKPFYSVANILLQHGVMDELALPLLFRGLSLESDWLLLNKTTEGEESNVPQHYTHPFIFHKVYSDPNVKHSFCSKYFLKILQN